MRVIRDFAFGEQGRSALLAKGEIPNAACIFLPKPLYFPNNLPYCMK